MEMDEKAGEITEIFENAESKISNLLEKCARNVVKSPRAWALCQFKDDVFYRLRTYEGDDMCGFLERILPEEIQKFKKQHEEAKAKA